jgi:DNA-binding IclR family transcriptional regulator
MRMSKLAKTTSSNPVRRISSIIDAVASSRNGLSLVEIASAVGLVPSTSHRTVNILMDIGYLRLAPETKTYHIGDRLKRVLLLDLGIESLAELAKPGIVALAEKFHETAYVAQYSSSGIQLVDYYFSTQGSRTLVHPGFDFPIHATAAGKAVYAFQSDNLIKEEISKGLERFMPNTLKSKKTVLQELAQVRQKGYAVNDSELDPGVYAVAAPVVIADSSVLGVIAIVGIKERLLKLATEQEISVGVMEAAAELSKMIYNIRQTTQRSKKPPAKGQKTKSGST